MLILREVLRWKAEEVAELLGTTVASVNSALQRARATLEASNLASTRRRAGASTTSRSRCCREYVDAFERYDIEALTALLHEDATLSMPPYDLWLQGERRTSLGWLVGPGRRVPGLAAGRRSTANGSAGVGASTAPSPDGGLRARGR